jgi:hypothetical protein
MTLQDRLAFFENLQSPGKAPSRLSSVKQNYEPSTPEPLTKRLSSVKDATVNPMTPSEKAFLSQSSKIAEKFTSHEGTSSTVERKSSTVNRQNARPSVRKSVDLQNGKSTCAVCQKTGPFALI